MPLLQDDFLAKIDAARDEETVHIGKCIGKMIRIYGRTFGKQCGQRAHLMTKEYANKYFKCNLTKDTGGPASDWRKKWPACGKFEEVNPEGV